VGQWLPLLLLVCMRTGRGSSSLLQNVSRKHAGWAGESVMVVSVQQQQQIGSGDGNGSKDAG
jgi:hypothetical protein